MRSLVFVVAVLLVVVVSAAPRAAAEPAGKFQIYVMRMDPEGQDAKRFTRASWGGGLSVLLSLRNIQHLLALEGGVDFTNFLSETTEFRDAVTGLRVEQQTNQYYVRMYLGPRAGLHGNGFIRPFMATHIAGVFYGIGTDVVIPDDTNRENEIRQTLSDENKAAFGWDVGVGVDWNILNRFPVETGVRFLKSFNVPQQLGDGSVEIQPGYIQYYVGVGANFPLEGR